MTPPRRPARRRSPRLPRPRDPVTAPRSQDAPKKEPGPGGVLGAAGRWGWLAACAGVWWVAGGGSRGAGAAVAFAAVIVLGEALRVGGEGGGRDGAPLATAGALGYALLGPDGDAGVVRAVSLALAATAAGAALRPVLPLLGGGHGSREPSERRGSPHRSPYPEPDRPDRAGRPDTDQAAADPFAGPAGHGRRGRHAAGGSRGSGPGGRTDGDTGRSAGERAAAAVPAGAPADRHAATSGDAPAVPPREVFADPPAAGVRHAARGGPDRRWRRAADAAGVTDEGRRRVLVVGVAAVCCQPLGGDWELAGTARAAYLVGVLAVTAGWDAVLAAAPAARRGAPAFVAALRDDLAALASLGFAVGAGGLVLALAATGAGPWAVLPAAVPPLLAQLSLRGHAAVRSTYRETVASLARATDVAGYTPPGHARRVSALATAVGRELGLTARRLRVLEHAALMHDIGQLSLVDPLPHGATEPLDDERRQAVAALGGEVVRRTGAPGEVALVVERQAHPYREQPLAGRIVRVANAYEDLLGAAAAGPQPLHTRLAAVERMRLATAYDYDPRVVEALTRVLARQSARAWLDAPGDGKEDR